jgi:hypothetical protein
VQPGLGGQQRYLRAGHVGDVGGQQVDAAPQLGRQRLEQVALVDLAARSADVSPSAAGRGRVDIDGVQLDVAQRCRERGADRAGAAAQVHHHDRPRPGLTGFLAGAGVWGAGWLGGVRPGPARFRADEGHSVAHQELGSAAGNEHARVHGDTQAAELRPADDVLKRQAGHSLVYHLGQAGRRPGRADEQPRLVLGEDAAGRPEPGDDS